MSSDKLGKKPGETWRECVQRLGDEWAIGDEVVEMFDELIFHEHMEEADAAWQACFECEVLPVADSPSTSDASFEGSLT